MKLHYSEYHYIVDSVSWTPSKTCDHWNKNNSCAQIEFAIPGVQWDRWIQIHKMCYFKSLTIIQSPKIEWPHKSSSPSSTFVGKLGGILDSLLIQFDLHIIDKLSRHKCAQQRILCPPFQGISYLFRSRRVNLYNLNCYFHNVVFWVKPRTSRLQALNLIQKRSFCCLNKEIHACWIKFPTLEVSFLSADLPSCFRYETIHRFGCISITPYTYSGQHML